MGLFDLFGLCGTFAFSEKEKKTLQNNECTESTAPFLLHVDKYVNEVREGFPSTDTTECEQISTLITWMVKEMQTKTGGYICDSTVGDSWFSGFRFGKFGSKTEFP